MAKNSARPEELLSDDAFVRRLAHRLVHDAQRAEDVAQSALAAALADGPGEPRSLRAWLVSVVRHLASKELRSSRHREERERAVARPIASASVAEILERESVRRRVVESLIELEEPYRSTLVLRFYDGMPPRRIAQVMGVPVETVRTRTKRGLAMLRARLDREMEGGCAAWCAALLPLAVAREAVPMGELVRELALEVITMSTKAKLFAVGAALAGLALVLSRIELGPGSAKDPPDAMPGNEIGLVEPPAVSEESPAAVESQALDRSSRAPVPSEAASEPPEPLEQDLEPSGTLLLRVTWEQDGAPAARVLVRICPFGVADQPFRAFDVETDADGAARIERVPCGTVGLQPLFGGFESVEVAAGQEVEFALSIPLGVGVRGFVVDRAARAVEGAEIWLSVMGNFDHGRIVAHTDAEGAFHLRSVDSGRWIGARSKAHAPSLVKFMTGAPGAEIPLRFVLRGPCGRIEGSVLDSLGAAVEGALVRAGSGSFDMVAGEDAEGGMASVPFEALTGADGGFVFEGIEPGRVPVAVRAPRFAVWRGEVDVLEGLTARVDASLSGGVDVEGRVVTGDGAPAARVEIAIGDWGKLGHQTLTDTDGIFLLEDVEPGEIRVDADGGDRGRAEAVLHALVGERVVWEPVLATGGELHGRLLSEAGAPLEGWNIQIASVHRSAKAGEAIDDDYHNDSKQTDAEGRFVFKNLRDREHELEVRVPQWGAFASLVEDGFRPQAGEIVLRVPDAAIPSVYITGRVLDVDGSPAGGAMIIPWRGNGTSPIEHPDPTTGDFLLGPYPPGEWSLALRADGVAMQRLGPRALAPKERWDVGTVRLGVTGSLLVRFERDVSAPAGEAVFALSYAGAPIEGDLERDGDIVQAPALPPGEYALGVGGQGFANSFYPFEVHAGEETVLDVPLSGGVPRSVRVVERGATSSERLLRLSALDESGRTVMQSLQWRQPGEGWEDQLWLAPGTYRIEARTEDGRIASATVEIAEAPRDDMAEVAVVIEMLVE